MFKRILVAVDGTPASNAGLQAAIELAADQKAKLVILHVVDDAVPAVDLYGAGFPSSYYDDYMRAMQQIGQNLVKKAAAAARDAGLEVEPIVVRSVAQTVAHVVIARTRKVKADLIVLGTHGRRGIRRVLMGSDAEAILREATVPVLLLRGRAGRARRTVAKPTAVKRRPPPARAYAAP